MPCHLFSHDSCIVTILYLLCQLYLHNVTSKAHIIYRDASWYLPTNWTAHSKACSHILFCSWLMLMPSKPVWGQRLQTLVVHYVHFWLLHLNQCPKHSSHGLQESQPGKPTQRKIHLSSSITLIEVLNKTNIWNPFYSEDVERFEVCSIFLKIGLVTYNWYKMQTPGLGRVTLEYGWIIPEIGNENLPLWPH